MYSLPSSLVKCVGAGQSAGISFTGDAVRHEPYVSVTPLRLSSPMPARKRHKRCRRMLFDRRKTHAVQGKCPTPLACNLNTRKSHSTGCVCLCGFHGFSNELIAESADQSRSAMNFLESTFLLVGDRGVKCLSISACNTDHHVQHLMKVIPLKRVPIRVLSLFDGLGTGLYVLKEKMSLQVADYFSSEVDPHAIEVQRHHFHGHIHMLGCVTKLNETLLHSLGRIDLLLGGSPCNELSRVNPRRKGLFDPTGSGPLFFEYVRIRNFFHKQAAVGGYPFFWLFENVHNMDDNSKRQISRSLKCSPITKCASDFLPIKRKRLFWGNIPGMSSDEQEASSPSLKSLLRPYRTPTVSCLPTLTTTLHSQLSGPQQKHPIMDNGEGCGLTILEREIMFGFPEHYTDVGNLSNSQRLKLLGRSWCVPVIGSLLKPLSEMYAHL